MNKKITDAEKFSLIKREAFFTARALVGLIIFWLCAGFGTANFDFKFLHLPLWVWLGVFGTWFFAIFISFVLSKKIFTDFDLGGDDDE